jgi:hypothetical protein
MGAGPVTVTVAIGPEIGPVAIDPFVRTVNRANGSDITVTAPMLVTSTVVATCASSSRHAIVWRAL